MEEDKPWTELMDALSRCLSQPVLCLMPKANNYLTRSLYKDGKYSDLTVVCGESTYRAHKAVLCTRFQFFAKACDGAFQVS